jgi:uncharacterized protein YkwD
MRSRRVVLQLLAGGAIRAAVSSGQSGGDLRLIERRIFDAVNRERRRRNVPELDWDARLAAEARRHSMRMASAGFHSHTDPVRGDLVPRLNANGIPWHECAENIFIEQGYEGDPVPRAVRSWLESRGHRKNMLSPLYTHSGVGAEVSDDAVLCVTQEFTRP